jgi:hypothetical protein
MLSIPVRPLSAIAAFSIAATMSTSCSNTDTPAAAAKNGAPQSAVTGAATHPTPDSCTLLSADEAQVYVGTLTSPPFRSNDDGLADATGEACVYRGSGARQLTIARTGEGSAAAGRVMKDLPNAVGSALEKAGAGNLAATTHKVMAQAPDGPWDQATWIPGGTFIATKGDQGVHVDVGGASGKQEDAVALARLAMPRLDHPLDYDGARAAANLPKPKAHPANACDVVPQAAVEGAIGTFAAPPAPQTDGSQCAYQVASGQGPRTYLVAFTWTGGIKGFNTLKNGMSTLGSVMGGSIPTAGMDSMKMDPNMSKMMGGLMNLAGGGGGGAPGAATQVGFKTDTTLKGPWDSAMLLHGTQLFAVKGDVMVSMDLKSADYEKAKALLAAACSSL